jgi:hypothetical protein
MHAESFVYQSVQATDRANFLTGQSCPAAFRNRLMAPLRLVGAPAGPNIPMKRFTAHSMRHLHEYNLA